MLTLLLLNLSTLLPLICNGTDMQNETLQKVHANLADYLLLVMDTQHEMIEDTLNMKSSITSTLLPFEES
jgi:NADH:ubiquinone oxidoreductase subunit F (NADH-binding)